jgi:hypothetical protein
MCTSSSRGAGVRGKAVNSFPKDVSSLWVNLGLTILALVESPNPSSCGVCAGAQQASGGKAIEGADDSCLAVDDKGCKCLCLLVCQLTIKHDIILDAYASCICMTLLSGDLFS